MDPGTTSPSSPLEIGRLNLKELEQLQIQVGDAITKKRETVQTDALAEIGKLVSSAGLTRLQVAQHLGLKSVGTRKGRRVPPKYRDPQNPASLWSGRGKPPRWLVAYEENGGKREDCLIEGGE